MYPEYLPEIVEELLSQGMNTMEYYFEIRSHLTEERKQLHETIIDNIINIRNFSRNKRAYILGGAPANGKSTFLKSAYCNYPGSSLKIDPDEIKKALPEYSYMIAAGEPLAASVVHEESSVIAKKLRQAAMKDGIDIILDGVADGTLQNRKDEYDSFKKNGYFIRMDYVSLDTDLSLILAKKRAEETCREVPQDFVKDMNRTISRLVPEIIEKHYFDELFLWDTNEETAPRLIVQYKNGKLEVVNNALFDNFKNKAK